MSFCPRKSYSIATASGFPQTAMSALPPKADMCGAATDVRYGSEADMLPFSRFKLRPGVNARLFPHIVEMRVPLGGFGSKLDAMHRWHEARGIPALNSTGRRDENNRDYIRWCLADPAAAKEFDESFADMIA